VSLQQDGRRTKLALILSIAISTVKTGDFIKSVLFSFLYTKVSWNALPFSNDVNHGEKQNDSTSFKEELKLRKVARVVDKQSQVVKKLTRAFNCKKHE